MSAKQPPLTAYAFTPENTTTRSVVRWDYATSIGQMTWPPSDKDEYDNAAERDARAFLALARSAP